MNNNNSTKMEKYKSVKISLFHTVFEYLGVFLMINPIKFHRNKPVKKITRHELGTCSSHVLNRELKSEPRRNIRSKSARSSRYAHLSRRPIQSHCVVLILLLVRPTSMLLLANLLPALIYLY